MAIIVTFKTVGYIPENLDSSFIIGDPLNEKYDTIFHACLEDDCDYIAKEIPVYDEEIPDGCYNYKDYVRNEILISQFAADLGIAPKVHTVSLNSEKGIMIIDKYDGDLNDLLNLYIRDKFIPMEDILQTLEQIIQTLHNNGIVHRDIFPRNILYTKDGTIALADYGMAVVSDSDKFRNDVWENYNNIVYIAKQIKNGRLSDETKDVNFYYYFRKELHSNKDINKIEIMFNGKICPDLFDE